MKRRAEPVNIYIYIYIYMAAAGNPQHGYWPPANYVDPYRLSMFCKKCVLGKIQYFSYILWGGILAPNPVAPRSGPESFVLGPKKVSVKVSVTDPDMDRYRHVADGVGGRTSFPTFPAPSLQSLPHHCHPTPRVMPRGVLFWCGKTCWSPSNSSTRICEPACGVSGGPFSL